MNTRRDFLAAFSRGAVCASLAPTLLLRPWYRSDTALQFGALEPLATWMHELDADAMQARAIEALRRGTSLETLVAAGALANAREFGGDDYEGFHCLMALIPALQMRERLPSPLAALGVLKVLHRNTRRFRARAALHPPVLTALEPSKPRSPAAERERFLAAYRAGDVEGAEQAFVNMGARAPLELLGEVTAILFETLDVHRIVLAWRACETAQTIGAEHARTLLRQSVRYCALGERGRIDRELPPPPLREKLPAWVQGAAAGHAQERRLSSSERDQLVQTVFGESQDRSAQAVADAIASGVALNEIGDVLSRASNRLLLHDRGHSPDDPRGGAIHGPSRGVHAQDAASAWRHIARSSSGDVAIAALIAGAYHTAGQSEHVGAEPLPYEQYIGEVEQLSALERLAYLRSAIEDKHQPRAMAATTQHLRSGGSVASLLDVFLDYALSQDGALHAEKYFHTTCENCASASSDAQVERYLLGLARVTASEFGEEAPGQAAARAALRT